MAETISMSVSIPSQDTQEFNETDNDFVDNANNNSQLNPWARLFSIHSLFPSIELIDNDYSFGRGKTCSIKFDSKEILTSKYYPAYSSTHFQIVRDPTSNCVYLTDLSSNGTFVNGQKIGKTNRCLLENNAEIALASKVHKVFVFIDASTKDDLPIPNRLKQKYIISKQIGRGAYGEVRLCFARDTFDRFAIKIIGKKHFTSAGAQAVVFNEKIKLECSILKQLSHPSIIRIVDVDETDDALYIILELVEGGELFDRIVANGQFSEATTKFVFRQMCLGVQYLHDHSITHRDLKPENILLSSPDTNETLIKITDFGLSKLINETSLMKTFCGTPNYLAPEILAYHGSVTYTNKIDVWSLGVILFICLVGYPPFGETSDRPSLNEQILKGLYTFPDEFWSDISASVKDLIRKMMCVDPNQRLTINGVLEHPWLADDHDNTARVQKLMYPALTPTKSIKRPNPYDSMEMDASDGESLSNGMSYTQNKRAKH